MHTIRLVSQGVSAEVSLGYLSKFGMVLVVCMQIYVQPLSKFVVTHLLSDW